jgi:sirohydrochlorin ferrochelatase
MEFPRKARLGEAARNGESPPVREGFVRSGAQPSIESNVRPPARGVKAVFLLPSFTGEGDAADRLYRATRLNPALTGVA